MSGLTEAFRNSITIPNLLIAVVVVIDTRSVLNSRSRKINVDIDFDCHHDMVEKKEGKYMIGFEIKNAEMSRTY